jgi:hypothetical protein
MRDSVQPSAQSPGDRVSHNLFPGDLMSHNVLIKWFSGGQLPPQNVNLFFRLLMVNNKSTSLRGGRLSKTI